MSDPQAVEELRMSVEIPNVERCPLCDCDAELHEGFDVDCESTTAIITCTACPISYGPIYPDTKEDVRKFVQDWNNRTHVKQPDEEAEGWCGSCACQSCYEAQQAADHF